MLDALTYGSTPIDTALIARWAGTIVTIAIS